MSVLTKVLLGAVPVIAVLVAAAFVTPATMSYLGRQAILFAWGVVGIILAEHWLFGSPLRQSLETLGIRPARGRAVAVATIVSLPMWLAPAVLLQITRAPIEPAANWPVSILGVFLLNGVAEELIHRGFIFTHLRADFSFGRAATISAAIFAAQHVYLIFTTGLPVGLASILLAIGLTFPLSFLFERGGRSLVAPAILHTSANAPVMMFSSTMGAPLVLAHMLVILASMYLSFAFWPWLTGDSD